MSPITRPMTRRSPALLAAATLALAFSSSPANEALAGKAAPAKAPGDGAVHLPVTTFKLPNGLTVFVNEDHTVPIVTVNLWYHVGSKDERPGRTGFAHLFEHLMFQGSQDVGDDEHLRLVAEAGGSANASTSPDRTNFFETVPSNFLERALYLEADRMGWFLSALDQKKLDNQRDVVLNERRQRYENAPYGLASFKIHEAIYPSDHPYHWLTIGSADDLLAASLDDVKAFFASWYTPNNAALALAGDVTPAEAKRLVTKYFAEIPAHTSPAREEVRPVKLDKDKRDSLTDRVTLERLYLSWPSPAWFQPGDADLDLLATVLGGKSGRLYQRLVHDLKVAQSVSVGQSSAKLGSLFQIMVTARPGHTAAEMERLVDEEIAKVLGDRPITKDELARGQTRWEASFVYGMQSLDGRADMLNAYFEALGTADGMERDRRRYLDATVESVQKAAAAVLKSHRHVLVVGPPRKAAPPQAGPAASAAPTTGAAQAAPSTKKEAR